MPRNNALSKRTSGKPVEQLIYIDDLEVWIRRKRVKNLSIYVKSPSARIEVSTVRQKRREMRKRSSGAMLFPRSLLRS